MQFVFHLRPSPDYYSDQLLLTDILAFCEFSFGPVIIIVAILAQGVAAMSEAAAMG